MIRGIAWEAQRRKRGGLRAETRRVLRAAVKNAAVASEGDVRRTRRKRSEVGLEQGTRLIRTRRGRDHEDTVLEPERRYRHDGREYKRLSQVAREITGTRWSGPRFFGLAKPKPGKETSTRRAS